MTEIWTVRADGSDPMWIKTYLGEPGGLLFLSHICTIVYLERGLRQAAFGGHLVGGHTIPMVRNRVWRLSPDGANEALWPLPSDIHAEQIAIDPSGEMLAVVGYRGGLLSEGERGLWIVNAEGGSRLLVRGQISGPLDWAESSRLG